MNRITPVVAILGIALLILAGLVWAGSWLNQPAAAWAQGQVVEPVEVRDRTVSVTGHGRVAARPDTVTIRIGVETEDETAAEAMAENNLRMRAVISATLGAGVDDDDIQTQAIQLQPIYDQRPATGATGPRVIGYRARNIVQVTVRDPEEMGGLLDAIVQAGGTNIENIQFQIADLDEALNEARAAAMADAQQKATLLVNAAGAELGEVVTIIEFDGPIPLAGPTMQREAAVTDVPIQPGLELIEARVQVVWRIR